MNRRSLSGFRRAADAWPIASRVRRIGVLMRSAADSAPTRLRHSRPWGRIVCRQSISDSWLGNLREYLAHLV
jgi:hypothetical protein